MDWDKLRVFHTVADCGSFTHAGERLGLSQSAVSRQIRGLEEDLKVSLFHRHARGLTLTQEGEMLFATARDVVSKIIATERELIEGNEKPRGELKVTTTLSFGSTWLTHNIKEFVELYPDIELHLLLSDKDLDLTTREADVAILFHQPSHVDLIQRQIMTLNYHIYASPEYLEAFGTPQTAQDLDHHRLITYGLTVTSPIRDINWIMRIGAEGAPRKPILQINNIYGALQAVKAGIGIAALPDYLVRDSSNVVRILETVKNPKFKVYFVYPQEQRHSKRVAAFRDYLISKVGASVF
jgi:DNA-binding transcriptional LysR family regulator